LFSLVLTIFAITSIAVRAIYRGQNRQSRLILSDEKQAGLR
jgi:hypothetical protein